MPSPNTPCIGVCSTTFGDQVCRGCKRQLPEIVGWNSYDDNEKQIVWNRLNALIVNVMDNYFEVNDSWLLQEMIQNNGIRLQTKYSPEGWILELLRASERHIDYARFGLHPVINTNEYPGSRAIYDAISSDLYELAEAHYQMTNRYSERENKGDQADMSP